MSRVTRSIRKLEARADALSITCPVCLKYKYGEWLRLGGWPCIVGRPCPVDEDDLCICRYVGNVGLAWYGMIKARQAEQALVEDLIESHTQADNPNAENLNND